MSGSSLERLMGVLKRLAAPAAEQAEYLVMLGVAPSADELALEFDDVFPAARCTLSADQLLAVEELDRLLNEMSHAEESVWSVDDLASDSSWHLVREKARRAVETLRM